MSSSYDPERDGPRPGLQPHALQRAVGEAVIALFRGGPPNIKSVKDPEALAQVIGETAIKAIGNPALENLTPGEPFFVLRGRDPCSTGAIHHWISLAVLRGCPPAKLRDAEERITEMHNWPVKKAPD